MMQLHVSGRPAQSTSIAKQCFKCGKEKPLSDFYCHPMMGDGHLNKCKDCTRSDVRANRVGNIERYLIYDRARHRKPARNTKHVWRGMLKRCHDPNDQYYHRYGGRGIKVCERWHNFEGFLADMGYRPPGLTIERIDNNGNYEPGNCKWIPPAQQARNRRDSRWIELNGERRVLQDWANISGIAPSLICYHLKRGRSLASIFARRGYQHTAPNSNGDSF